jgi:hypothetical protein
MIHEILSADVFGVRDFLVYMNVYLQMPLSHMQSSIVKGCGTLVKYEHAHIIEFVLSIHATVIGSRFCMFSSNKLFNYRIPSPYLFAPLVEECMYWSMHY